MRRLLLARVRILDFILKAGNHRTVVRGEHDLICFLGDHSACFVENGLAGDRGLV